MLNKEVLPIWGKRKAKDITRRDVITLLDEIVERGAPIQANRTLAVIRVMFNFAISRDIIDATPVAMVKAPSKENQRDRVLSADEIRTFWNGLDKASMREGTKLVLKLQLVTAQRKGEIVGAAWSEIDEEQKVWTVPTSRSKNGKAHSVPLSPLALSLFQEARDLAGDSPWLFPAPNDHGPIHPRSINNALYNAHPPINVDNMTPHDLRRAAASFMTSLGISRLTVSKILNHAESGVTAVYDRYAYDAEKRHALDTWAAHLEGILSGKPAADNVVVLATAGETT